MPLGDGLFSMLTVCFLAFFPPDHYALSLLIPVSLAVYFFLAGQQMPARFCLVAVLVAQPHLHPGCQAQTEALKTAPFASVSDRLVSQTTITRSSQHGMAMVTSILWALHSKRLCSPLPLFSLMSSFVSSSSGDLARLCRTRPHQRGQRPDGSLACSSTRETSHSRAQNRSLGIGLRP